MGALAEIDEDRLTELWVAGYSAEAIAAAFGVTSLTVVRRAERIGLRKRGRGWRSPHEGRVPPAPRKAVAAAPRAPDPEVLLHPHFCEARDAEILKTGGAYASLRVLAARWRLSFTQVQLRWHRIGGRRA